MNVSTSNFKVREVYGKVPNIATSRPVTYISATKLSFVLYLSSQLAYPSTDSVIIILAIDEEKSKLSPVVLFIS
ncbi:MAG: hypothetical protein PHS44_06830 [Candidatus Dojkabacteria bacterium]|nr:hypothetical protein [Candidatus Dojkabacteria bacterium]